MSTHVLLLVVGAVGYGIASALIPVVNAEAYVVAVCVTARPSTAIAQVVGMLVGTVIGKILLFLGARHGKRLGRLLRRHPEEVEAANEDVSPGRFQRSLKVLDQPVSAAPLLLVSAGVGIPPLAVTTIAAGLRRTPLPLFVVCVALGRAARFAVIAGPTLVARH